MNSLFRAGICVSCQVSFFSKVFFAVVTLVLLFVVLVFVSLQFFFMLKCFIANVTHTFMAASLMKF